MNRPIIPGPVGEMLNIFLDKHVSRTAAAVAYYMTFSIFPFIICVNFILGSLNIDIASVLELLDKIIPESALTIISGYITYITANDSPALLVAGLLLLLTMASAAFRSISSIVLDIQGSSRFKGFWGMVTSFAMALVLILMIYAAAIIVLTGEWFLRLLDRYFQIGYWGIWRWLRFVLLFFIIGVMVYIIYYMSQPKDSEAPVMTGAITATAVMVVVSVIFSLFINLTTKYTLVYGSLASIIILMFWIYICGIVLIMGNALNIVLLKWGIRRKNLRKSNT